jgi:hypothetical protein
MYKQSLIRKLKKMFGINKKEETFYGTFRDTWIEAGGLISQATARRLLERTKGRVTQMIKEGKLKPYTIEGVTYLSYAEVMEKAKKIQIRLARAKAEEELKKLGFGEEINSGLMAQFDEVLKYDPNESED